MDGRGDFIPEEGRKKEAERKEEEEERHKKRSSWAAAILPRALFFLGVSIEFKWTRSTPKSIRKKQMERLLRCNMFH